MQDHFSGGEKPTQIDRPQEFHADFSFWIKREDLHPCGSHKHFAADHQVAHLKEHNLRGVLATSGNAGVASAIAAQKQNVEVYILIAPEASQGKIKEISTHNAHTFISQKCARLTNYISAKHGLYNLRPSMDSLAVEGFQKLGKELYMQFVELQKAGQLQNFWEEVYTFSTSGASYVGMYRAFEKLLEENLIEKIPQMHCVTGYAGRSGNRNSPRKKEIEKILEYTGGQTFEISEESLHEFKSKHPEITQSISDESLSSLMAALQNNAGSHSLVISTGKRWNNTDTATLTMPTLASIQDCDALFS